MSGAEIRPWFTQVQGAPNRMVAQNTSLWRIMQVNPERVAQAKAKEGDKVITLGEGWLPHEPGWQFNEQLQTFYHEKTGKFMEVDKKTQQFVESIDRPVASFSQKIPLRILAEGFSTSSNSKHVVIKDLLKAGKALKFPMDHVDRPAAMFAIYDGFGGTSVTEFVAKTMHMKVLKELSEYKGYWSNARLERAMKHAFEEVDQEVSDQKFSPAEGCSVLVAILLGHRIVVAHVGDADAQILRSAEDMGPMMINERHLAETDRLRLVKLGEESYTKGDSFLLRSENPDLPPIGLARACGASGYRTFQGKPLLLNTPDVRIVPIASTDHVLVLSSRSVKDALGSFGDIFKQFDLKPRAASGQALHEAKQKDATGCCITVFFDWEEENEEPVKKKAKTEAPNSIRCRHILLDFNKRSQVEAEEKLRDLLRELGSDDSKFHKLALLHTEDEKTKNNGGDLWWLQKSQRPTPFDDAAFNLPVHGISDIVITKNGAHLINRLA